MPNNQHPDLLLVGPKSLLEAAYKEVSKFPQYQPIDNTQWVEGNQAWKGLYICGKKYWLSEGAVDKTPQVLTLPQDWDQLMAILEDLKKPRVPEYVTANACDKGWKVYKITASNNGVYQAYDVMGKQTHFSDEEDVCTPITEEEFIQAGLKELEEAGYVVDAKVQYKDPIYTKMEYTITKLGYRDSTGYGPEHLLEKEVREKGFSFIAYGGIEVLPISQLTIVPKAPSLPTTSQGIPYLPELYNGKVLVGPTVGGLEIPQSVLRMLLKQGVTSLGTKIGKLTTSDLTKLASL